MIYRRQGKLLFLIALLQASAVPAATQPEPSAQNSGALVELDDGSLVVAGGSAVEHRYNPAEKLLPVFLGLGYGYGGNTFESSAFALSSVTREGACNVRFGQEGSVVTPLPPFKNHDGAVVTTLLRDSTNRLIAVGWRWKTAGLGSKVMVATAARYSSSGALDTTFGERGIVTSGRSGDNVTRASAALLDAQGRLVFAGYAGGRTLHSGRGKIDDWSNHLVVARYTTDNRLDSTFGSGGFADADVAPAPTNVVANPGCQQTADTCLWLQHQVLKNREREFLVYGDAPAGLALDPQGRMIAGASASDGTFILARFLASGIPDPTFGVGGVTRNAMGASSSVSQLLLDRDGRLLAIGSVGERIVLVRYTATGALDTAFGAGGTRETGFAKKLTVSGAVLDPDGHLFVAASSENTLAIGRFEPDGTPSKGFGSNGVLSAEVSRLTGPAGLSVNPSLEPTVAARSELGVALLHASIGR